MSPRRSSRKITTLLLTLFLLFSYSINAYADIYIEKDEIKNSVFQKIQFLNKSANTTYSNAQGLLYTVNVLNKMFMYLYYIERDTILQFPKEQITLYKENLYRYASKFNSTYSTIDAKKAKPHSLTLPTDKDGFTANIYNDLLTANHNYIVGLLDDISNELKALPDDKKAAYIKSKGVEIRYIYAIIQGVFNTFNDLSAIVPADLVPGTQIHMPDIAVWNILVSTPKYKDLLDEGKKLNDSSIEQLVAVKINDGNTFLDVLSNSDGTFTTAYLAMLSASAVYSPYKSRVGDADFLKALRARTSDEKVISMYEKSKNRLKPLYYRAVNKKGEPEGSAKTITIAEFNDMILKLQDGVLVTVNGQFKKQADTNAYGYYNGDGGAVTVTVPPPNSNNNTNSNINNPPINSNTPANTPTNTPTQTPPSSTTSEVETSQKFIPHSNEITEESDMTKPVFVFGKFTPSSGTSLALMNNILKDVKDLSSIAELDKRFLYVNMYGDIVTDDNIVIVPGSANPTYYKYNTAYYPYTLAFMKSYPKLNTRSNVFQLMNDRDKNKYLFAGNTGIMDVMRDVKPWDVSDDLSMNISAYRAKSSDKLQVTTPLRVKPLTTKIPRSNGDFIDFFKVDKLTVGDDLLSHLPNMAIRNAVFYIQDTTNSLQFETPVDAFTYEGLNASSQVPDFLSRSMYESLTMTSSGPDAKANGRLDSFYMYSNVFLPCLDGLEDVSAFSKNSIADFEAYVTSNASRLDKTIGELFRLIIPSLTEVDGVIGLKTAYQNPVFGTFLLFTEKYLIYILIFVLVFFVIKYIRQSAEFFYTIGISILSVILAYLFIKVIPIYIPNGYNFITSNVAEPVGYNALLMRVEKYNKAYRLDTDIDKNGRFVMSSSSINLYKFTENELDAVTRQLKVNREELTSGEAVVVDEITGVFIEGDALKVNLDRLYANLPITGSYSTIEGIPSYQITSEKMSSNIIDYYTPYYQIVDGFIGKLNKMTEIYSIPKSSLYYGGNMYKDSFMVSSYINSPLFLTPGDFSEEEGNLDPYVLEKLKLAFESNVDFLGISEFLMDTSGKYNDTLWYQTLQQNGYTTDNEKMWDLINYVNFQTKKFMIDNKDQVKFVSDENMIKTISLFALTTLNQKVSELNNYLYPITLNYEEIKLKDVFLPVFTSDYDRYLSQNMDITSYIQSTYKFFGVILFFLISLFSYIIINVVNYSIPILYILLLVVFFIRFVSKSAALVVIKNYMKISAIIFISYSVFGLITSVSTKINSSILVLLFLALVDGIIASILLFLVMAVIADKGDLAGDKVNHYLSNLVNKTKLSAAGNFLKVKTTNILNKEIPPELVNTASDIRYDRYKYNSTGEEYYDDGKSAHKVLRNNNRSPYLTEDDIRDLNNSDSTRTRRRSRRNYGNDTTEDLRYENYKL